MEVVSDAEAVMEEADILPFPGKLLVRFHYDSDSQILHVHVVQGFDIKGKQQQLEESPDTFVKLFLLPDNINSQQTPLIPADRNPVYDAQFQFPLVEEDFSSPRSLVFYIYAVLNFSATELLAEAEVPLRTIPLFEDCEKTLQLEDLSSQAESIYGELLCSLGYQPITERLTVVVVRAKNLSTGSPGAPGAQEHSSLDPYVKIYLLEEGRRAQKKKTSIKRHDLNPVFNEALIFRVPKSSLKRVSLRLVVMDAKKEGNAAVVGLVSVGSNAKSPKAISHWSQVLKNASVRKPVCMWHPLQDRHGYDGVADFVHGHPSGRSSADPHEEEEEEEVCGDQGVIKSD